MNISEALIVIDVQNGFCPGGALAVADGDAVVGPINQMIETAPLVYCPKTGNLRPTARFTHHMPENQPLIRS